MAGWKMVVWLQGGAERHDLDCPVKTPYIQVHVHNIYVHMYISVVLLHSRLCYTVRTIASRMHSTRVLPDLQ